MELALHADALPPATPIEESIRVAALCGFPWLLFALDALDAFFAHPDFDIRDLRRLFLRTQPAAAGTLALPDGDPAHHALVERHCRAVRRVGAPVLVLRLAAPDERVAALADIAARWGVVLALAPDEAGGAPTAKRARTSLLLVARWSRSAMRKKLSRSGNIARFIMAISYSWRRSAASRRPRTTTRAPTRRAKATSSSRSERATATVGRCASEARASATRCSGGRKPPFAGL